MPVSRENTKAAAEAVANGVRAAGGEVVVKNASEAQSEDLLNCDAVALGSYDAFSYMGGGLKDFFDFRLPPDARVKSPTSPAPCL